MDNSKLFLDTNAVLNLQDDIFKQEFLISQVTLQELESIKTSANKDAEIKYQSRKAIRLLDQNTDSFKVIITNQSIEEIIEKFHLTQSPDSLIIAAAYFCNKNEPIIFCTDDICCKCLAKEVFGLTVKSTEEINENSRVAEHRGYHDVTLSDEQMSKFYANPNNNHFLCLENEYLIVRKSDGEVVDIQRWSEDKFHKVCDVTIRSTLFGDKIRPKDAYQSCVIDSMLNNTMTAITGRAGSGKSLLSLVTIMSLIEAGKYDRVVIMFNPTKAKGSADMGYYSGDAMEKAMQNSIGSILTTKFGDRFAVDLLLQQDKIKLVSMADIRGMEVRDNEILYITEAQNTSVELLKLCLSRCSSECKIIIEGDYTSQVDSCFFENRNNGLKRAIEVLAGEPEFGYIQLKNVWRSRIAQLVDKF